MAVTGLERADSLLITTGKPVEAKYGPFSGAGIPAAIAEAESEILPLSIRFKGLTVGLIDTNNSGTTVVEYWFESGTADGDLVLKSSGGTVGGTGTVSKVPYWNTTTTLSDSPITRETAESVSVLYDLQIKGGGSNKEPNVRWYSNANTNFVDIQGPPTAQETDAYQLTLPSTIATATPQTSGGRILESDSSGKLEFIPTPSGGVGGSGTAGKLARWKTTSELDESCVDEAVTGIVNIYKIGGNATTDTVSYFDTVNRVAGIRTITPTTGFPFDVNTSMRVGSELNVGFSNERNLVVQGFTTLGEPSAGSGYVEMGSYGQGNINGHPSSFKDPQSSTLRMSTGFGRQGRVVDNYIYDTFEITLAALQALGDRPSTGVVLVNTPAALTCILADFWFYRQINTDTNNPTGYSDMGSWEDGELVIYPSNDLSGSSISSPYEQGYFRVTNDFLTTATSGAKFNASTALYQGNINGIDQGGMNGAWQIGNESFPAVPSAPPLGNKVYLSMATGQNPPTFLKASTTRFFIGLKYRFLSINGGILTNPDLITIDVQTPIKTHDYTKCREASSASCGNMPQAISIADIGQPVTTAAIFAKTSTGDKCCYEFVGGGFKVADTDYTIIGTFEECDDLPEDCAR